ncbi:Auxin response factor 17 [Linum perenne]
MGRNMITEQKRQNPNIITEMSPPSFSSGVDPRSPCMVDRRIWQSCAGSSVHIPTLNSRVYYFPQGHLEQSSSSISSALPFLSSQVLSTPMILCRLSSVQFLADPVTDEVYAKLLLLPLDAAPLPHPPPSSAASDDDGIMAYAKVLTASDANNGGGFSVPRFCADSIFPPLNYEAEPPVQTLSVSDVHGTRWDFRHIYRGTPRRHLLTTGWSKFVNSKKLIAGDSVLFMKNFRGEMFIGVRRASRSNDAAYFARWRDHFITGGDAMHKEDGTRTSARGMLSPQTVAEVTERAAKGLQFEVVYYPRSWSFSDFVVSADVVDAALSMFWSSGTRIKMAVESEDLSRVTWFQGTVASAAVPASGPWQGSPWRMLQIKWDEPEVLQSAQRVSPWRVECVSTNSSFGAGIPPAKKLRYPDKSELLIDGERDLRFPMSGLVNSTMGHMNPPLSYNNFPAGMQGARHYSFSPFELQNFASDNGLQVGGDTPVTNNMVPKMSSVSTELNIGSSQSENLSPDSQSSVQSFSTELTGNQGCTCRNWGTSSFQLFGKMIHMSRPVERSCDENGKECKDNHSVNNLLDLSLTSSYSEVVNKMDVQCRRCSAMEAYEQSSSM